MYGRNVAVRQTGYEQYVAIMWEFAVSPSNETMDTIVPSSHARTRTTRGLCAAYELSQHKFAPDCVESALIRYIVTL